MTLDLWKCNRCKCLFLYDYDLKVDDFYCPVCYEEEAPNGNDSSDFGLKFLRKVFMHEEVFNALQKREAEGLYAREASEDRKEMG